MIRLLYYTPFFCKNSTFPFLTGPLSIKHHDGRDFKTIPLTLFAHTTTGMGTCIYKYSLSSKNMTVFDYLLPFTIISVKSLPLSLWITFPFIDRNMLNFSEG